MAAIPVHRRRRRRQPSHRREAAAHHVSSASSWWLMALAAALHLHLHRVTPWTSRAPHRPITRPAHRSAPSWWHRQLMALQPPWQQSLTLLDTGVGRVGRRSYLLMTSGDDETDDAGDESATSEGDDDDEDEGPPEETIMEIADALTSPPSTSDDDGGTEEVTNFMNKAQDAWAGAAPTAPQSTLPLKGAMPTKGTLPQMKGIDKTKLVGAGARESFLSKKSKGAFFMEKKSKGVGLGELPKAPSKLFPKSTLPQKSKGVGVGELPKAPTAPLTQTSKGVGMGSLPKAPSKAMPKAILPLKSKGVDIGSLPKAGARIPPKSYPVQKSKGVGIGSFPKATPNPIFQSLAKEEALKGSAVGEVGKGSIPPTKSKGVLTPKFPPKADGPKGVESSASKSEGGAFPKAPPPRKPAAKEKSVMDAMVGKAASFLKGTAAVPQPKAKAPGDGGFLSGLGKQLFSGLTKSSSKGAEQGGVPYGRGPGTAKMAAPPKSPTGAGSPAFAKGGLGAGKAKTMAPPKTLKGMEARASVGQAPAAPEKTPLQPKISSVANDGSPGATDSIKEQDDDDTLADNESESTSLATKDEARWLEEQNALVQERLEKRRHEERARATNRSPVKDLDEGAMDAEAARAAAEEEDRWLDEQNRLVQERLELRRAEAEQAASTLDLPQADAKEDLTVVDEEYWWPDDDTGEAAGEETVDWIEEQNALVQERLERRREEEEAARATLGPPQGKPFPEPAVGAEESQEELDEEAQWLELQNALVQDRLQRRRREEKARASRGRQLQEPTMDADEIRAAAEEEARWLEEQNALVQERLERRREEAKEAREMQSPIGGTQDKVVDAEESQAAAEEESSWIEEQNKLVQERLEKRREEEEKARVADSPSSPDAPLKGAACTQEPNVDALKMNRLTTKGKQATVDLAGKGLPPPPQATGPPTKGMPKSPGAFKGTSKSLVGLKSKGLPFKSLDVPKGSVPLPKGPIGMKSKGMPFKAPGESKGPMSKMAPKGEVGLKAKGLLFKSPGALKGSMSKGIGLKSKGGTPDAPEVGGGLPKAPFPTKGLGMDPLKSKGIVGKGLSSKSLDLPTSIPKMEPKGIAGLKSKAGIPPPKKMVGLDGVASKGSAFAKKTPGSFKGGVKGLDSIFAAKSGPSSGKSPEMSASSDGVDAMESALKGSVGMTAGTSNEEEQQGSEKAGLTSKAGLPPPKKMVGLDGAAGKGSMFTKKTPDSFKGGVKGLDSVFAAKGGPPSGRSPEMNTGGSTSTNGADMLKTTLKGSEATLEDASNEEEQGSDDATLPPPALKGRGPIAGGIGGGMPFQPPMSSESKSLGSEVALDASSSSLKSKGTILGKGFPKGLKKMEGLPKGDSLKGKAAMIGTPGKGWPAMGDASKGKGPVASKGLPKMKGFPQGGPLKGKESVAGSMGNGLPFKSPPSIIEGQPKKFAGLKSKGGGIPAPPKLGSLQGEEPPSSEGGEDGKATTPTLPFMKKSPFKASPKKSIGMGELKSKGFPMKGVAPQKSGTYPPGLNSPPKMVKKEGAEAPASVGGPINEVPETELPSLIETVSEEPVVEGVKPFEPALKGTGTAMGGASKMSQGFPSMPKAALKQGSSPLPPAPKAPLKGSDFPAPKPLMGGPKKSLESLSKGKEGPSLSDVKGTSGTLPPPPPLKSVAGKQSAGLGAKTGLPFMKKSVSKGMPFPKKMVGSGEGGMKPSIPLPTTMGPAKKSLESLNKGTVKMEGMKASPVFGASKSEGGPFPKGGIGPKGVGSPLPGVGGPLKGAKAGPSLGGLKSKGSALAPPPLKYTLGKQASDAGTDTGLPFTKKGAGPAVGGTGALKSPLKGEISSPSSDSEGLETSESEIPSKGVGSSPPPFPKGGFVGTKSPIMGGPKMASKGGPTKGLVSAGGLKSKGGAFSTRPKSLDVQKGMQTVGAGPGVGPTTGFPKSPLKGQSDFQDSATESDSETSTQTPLKAPMPSVGGPSKMSPGPMKGAAKMGFPKKESAFGGIKTKGGIPPPPPLSGPAGKQAGGFAGKTEMPFMKKSISLEKSAGMGALKSPLKGEQAEDIDEPSQGLPLSSDSPITFGDGPVNEGEIMIDDDEDVTEIIDDDYAESVVEEGDEVTSMPTLERMGPKRIGTGASFAPQAFTPPAARSKASEIVDVFDLESGGSDEMESSDQTLVESEGITDDSSFEERKKPLRQTTQPVNLWSGESFYGKVSSRVYGSKDGSNANTGKVEGDKRDTVAKRSEMQRADSKASEPRRPEQDAPLDRQAEEKRRLEEEKRLVEEKERAASLLLAKIEEERKRTKAELEQRFEKEVSLARSKLREEAQRVEAERARARAKEEARFIEEQNLLVQKRLEQSLARERAKASAEIAELKRKLKAEVQQIEAQRESTRAKEEARLLEEQDLLVQKRLEKRVADERAKAAAEVAETRRRLKEEVQQMEAERARERAAEEARQNSLAQQKLDKRLAEEKAKLNAELSQAKQKLNEEREQALAQSSQEAEEAERMEKLNQLVEERLQLRLAELKKEQDEQVTTHSSEVEIPLSANDLLPQRSTEDTHDDTDDAKQEKATTPEPDSVSYGFGSKEGVSDALATNPEALELVEMCQANFDEDSPIYKTSASQQGKDNEICVLPSEYPFVSLLRDSSPYIVNHRHSTIVYHIPGDLISDPTMFNSVMDDIALTWLFGMKIVLCVGCRQQILQRLERLHGKADDLGSSSKLGVRVTTQETLRILEEEAGFCRFEVERLLNRCLRNKGANCNVVSGCFLTAKKFGVVDGIDYQNTGYPTSLQEDRIHHFHTRNDVVLLTPLGFTKDGDALNIHSEALAAFTAGALDASKLVYFSTHPMVLHGQSDASSKQRIQMIERSNALQIMSHYGLNVDTKTGFPHWRSTAASPSDDDLNRDQQAMLLKMGWATHAIERGVERAHIIDCEDGALLKELFTARRGFGTCISQDGYEAPHPKDVNDDMSVVDGVGAGIIGQ